MRSLSQRVEESNAQTEFRPFWINYTDEYLDYVRQSHRLALVAFNPNQLFKFQYNSKGEKMLHLGEEASLGEYFGLKYRRNNIYNEVIFH